jgi:4-amino-4-deoxy-L-arabinose transferase-like glycosyltransferase
MGDRSRRDPGDRPRSRESRYSALIVLLIAAAVYLGCIISPPSLQDDVDAVQAQIARNMLTSGDWVTARLDGIPYLEKAPLIYWMIASCYRVLGVHDWVARLPVALSAIALCWLTFLFGRWAFGTRAGYYAGLCMATCIGLFLFTRIQIPDVMLTATTALAFWSFLRALDPEEERPKLWAFLLAACLGVGLLWKSLIGVLFPVAGGLIYLALTRQLLLKETWRRLRPFRAAGIILLIAAPWHVLAALRNPPVFDFTMQSLPGQYHGFLWFFFINEQLLRFLNLRYPRDYNTVPRLYFWLFHLLWLFPWSVYLPAVLKLSFRPVDRAGKTRLLALCWLGFVLVFFTFSTTQEYYSMPCYPAIALLIGSAIVAGGSWIRRGHWTIFAIATTLAIITLGLAFAVRNYPAPGDISNALESRPGTYTLSLDHMKDLTLRSFAYLRFPLVCAGIAFTIGAIGNFAAKPTRALLSTAVMMVLFFHAARLALIVFDPYLSSRPLADALLRSPQGGLMVDHHYYTYSSVFFYTNRSAYLVNGRINNLVYGSYAPGAPDVFIDDQQLREHWLQPERWYLVAAESALPRFESLVGAAQLHTVLRSGGKVLLTNLPASD